MRSRNLGKMRHQLQLQTITRTPDGGGGYARGDGPGDTVAARVDTIGALEANTYSQLQLRVTHKAMIRHRDDVTQGQTVIWQRPAAHGGDVDLYVETVRDADPDRRPGEFMLLICRQGGNL